MTTEPQPIFVILAAASIVLWLLVAALLSAVRQPRRPRPGPSTMDLGPEPPAVANLLTHDFEVTPDAVPATLLDLAARKLVDIEQVGSAYVCRIRKADKSGLTAYEARVLAHLERRQEGGIVPAAALSIGPRDESAGWWRRFRKDVIADCQRRGLCRPKWTAAVTGPLGLLAFAPLAFFGIGSTSAAERPAVEGETSFWAVAAIACFLLGFGVIGLAGALASSARQRDTEAGLAAAASWLGVQDHLAHAASFPDLPPAAVAVWDRYLGYGAALGVAAGAVRALPMGAEHENRAWSSYGGRWRQVSVRYPRLPPSRGRHPAWATFLTLFWGGLAVFGLERLAAVERPEPSSSLSATQIEWLMRGLSAAAVVLGLILVWALVVFVRAVPDLFVRRTVVGEVIRMRKKSRLAVQSKNAAKSYWWFVAVDTGRRDRIRAWAVRRDQYIALDQYREVTAEITPCLPYVRSIRSGPPAAPPTSSAP